jgi:uncharacterized protein YceK
MTSTAARVSLLIAGPALAIGLLSGCSSSSSDDAASASAPASSAASASASDEASGAASATPSGTPVATADLAALVSDRTFTGTYEGTTYVEYYAPDGAIRGEQDGEKYTASWEIVGDTVCFTYPEDGADAGPDCFTATQDGENVYWFNEDGSFNDATTWVTGNPNNF